MSLVSTQSSLNVYCDGMVEMLKRVDKLESQGFDKDAHAIDKEWEEGSSIDALYISIDSFVRI